MSKECVDLEELIGLETVSQLLPCNGREVALGSNDTVAYQSITLVWQDFAEHAVWALDPCVGDQCTVGNRISLSTQCMRRESGVYTLHY